VIWRVRWLGCEMRLWEVVLVGRKPGGFRVWLDRTSDALQRLLARSSW
jgi:hypothetical protein